MHKLSIRTNRLADGSETYDVPLNSYSSMTEFHAVTLEDAVHLAVSIRAAVALYSNDLIAFIEE